MKKKTIILTISLSIVLLLIITVILVIRGLPQFQKSITTGNKLDLLMGPISDEYYEYIIEHDGDSSGWFPKQKSKQKNSDTKNSVIEDSDTEEKPKNSDKIIGFDELQTTNSIEFSVSDSIITESLDPNVKSSFYSYLPDVEGEKYIIVNCSIKNISKDAISLDGMKSQFTIGGYNYSGNIYYNKAEYGTTKFIYSINPLVTQDVLFVASIPDSVADEMGYLFIGVNKDISDYYFYDIEDMDYTYMLTL